MGLLDDLMGVDESTGGFADIEPGAYKLVITKAEPTARDQYVRISWDVAEGDSKGAYEKSGWPPSDVLSWKQTALGMLKRKMHVLCDCNPQRLTAVNDAEGKFAACKEFAEAADGGGSFDFLVGCRFGAVVRRRLYTAGPNSKQPGADRHQMEVAKYLTPQEFADGDWSESLLKDRDQRDKTQAQPQAPAAVPDSFKPQDDLADEDIPF